MKICSSKFTIPALTLIVGFLIGTYVATILAFKYDYSTRNTLLVAIHQMLEKDDVDAASRIVKQDIQSNDTFLQRIETPTSFGFFFLSPRNAALAEENAVASRELVSEVVPLAEPGAGGFYMW